MSDAVSSSSPSSPAPSNQRLEELATGFAIGDLNEEELTDLHQLVSEQGPIQAEAVASCWASLQTTIDLRSVVGQQFEDTVRHRIRHPKGGSFVGSVLARIGLRRPKLNPLELPVDVPQPAGRPWWLLIPMVAVMLGLWLATRTTPLAEVQSVDGHAHHFGEALRIGMELEESLLSIDAGGKLVLALAQGASLTGHGPAQLTVHGSGLSLPQGRFLLRNGPETLKITLPDGPLKLEAGAVVELATHPTTSQSILLAGAASQISRGQSRPLTTGRVLQAGTDPWQWCRSLKLESRDQHLHLQADAHAASWHLQGRLAPAAASDRLIIRDALDGNRQLIITADQVTTLTEGSQQQQVMLPGAPLNPRTFRLQRDITGQCQLIIAGMQLTVPFVGAPLHMQLEGTMAVSELSYHDGPKPVDH